MRPAPGLPTRAMLAATCADGVELLLRRAPLGTGAGGFEVAVALARMLRWLDRRTDERIDVSRAGRALLHARPDAVERLARRLPEGTVVVSATNGKTTTTNLLASIVRRGGHQPVVNHVGANMAGGLAAELAARARIGGRMAADIGVFEVDELWLDQLVGPLAPRTVVLGNLFRDQLDRMGELDRLVDRWAELLDRLPAETTVVVSADDPRLCQLVGDRPGVVHVGLDDGGPAVDPWDLDGLPHPVDVADCRRCSGDLTYDATHIGHLGLWRCEGCGDARPEPLDVRAVDVRDRSLAGTTFTLVTPSARSTIRLVPPGRYNVLNAALAAAAARTLGVDHAAIVEGIAGERGAFGRAESITIDGRTLVLLLAKNPSGLQEVIELLAGEAPGGHLLILLNDGELDGRDVSWVWDAPVERLVASVATVTCGGTRAAEAALRVDCAGFSASLIEVVETDDASGVGPAVDRALARSDGAVWAIANYTALLDVRETLSERGHVPRYWS